MGTKQKARDKAITREIHRLFWRANLQTPHLLFGALLLRIPAFFLLHVSIPLTIAYGLQAIVDRRFGAVSGYAWQIVLYASLFAVFWGIAAVLIAKNGVKAGEYLQKVVFGNFLQKDFEFYGNAFFGSLGAQAMRLREAMNNDYNLIFTLGAPKQIVIVGGGIIVIGMNSMPLALITIGAMLVIMSWTIATSRWRLKYRRQLSEAGNELSGQIGDALTQASVVKSFAAEGYENDRLDGPLSRWSHAQYVSWALGGPSDMGRMFLTGAATAILLVVTARMYQAGTIGIAIVALVQLYVVKIFAATVDIADLIKTYETAMGGAYQPVKTMLVATTVNDPENPKTLPDNDQLGVTLEHASFRYDGVLKDSYALKDMNLEIVPGEKVGIVGYSGSGKTTLTKLLMRYMDVSDGAIRVGGVDIRDVTQHDLRHHIAYVPQEPMLFHRSVRENIAYGDPNAGNSAIETAAKHAYVDEFVADLPDGLDTLVGERGVKLSGGQRQRVAIARAILRDAPILVLDEATSALDSHSEQLIQKALWGLMKGRTAIVIAHRLSTIQKMDRIVVMQKGRIVQLGTHQELLQDANGVYAQLWSHQSGGYIGGTSEDA